MGLCGWLAAKMLRAPVIGTYHTDFPVYADKLTGDHRVANGTRVYIEWFYQRLAAVFSRSRAYELSLREMKVEGGAVTYDVSPRGARSVSGAGYQSHPRSPGEAFPEKARFTARRQPWPDEAALASRPSAAFASASRSDRDLSGEAGEPGARHGQP